MNLHILSPKEFTIKLLELINAFSKIVECKINIKESIAFLTLSMANSKRKFKKQFYLYKVKEAKHNHRTQKATYHRIPFI